MDSANFLPIGGGGDVEITSTGWSNTDLQAAVEAAAIANPDTAKEGDLTMEFVQDGTDIHLMVGSLDLGSASIASLAAGDSATLNFGTFLLGCDQ